MLQPILGLKKAKKLGKIRGIQYTWLSINSYNMLQPILGLEKGKKIGQNKGYIWFSNMVNDSAALHRLIIINGAGRT